MPTAGKWAVTVAVGLIGIVLAFSLSRTDLGAENHFLPKCSLHSLTGLYCPGCGNTRATQALLSGDLAGAAKQNIVFVIALPFLIFGAVRTWIQWVYPGHLRPLGFRWRYSYSVFLIALIVGFTILRNVPLSPFSWLAPVPLRTGTPSGNSSTENLSANPEAPDRDSSPLPLQ
jgi:hypothetical protein